MTKRVLLVLLLLSAALAVTNSPPSTPELGTPANESTVSTSTTSFNWSDSTDADGQAPKYDLYVKTGSSMGWWNASWRYRTQLNVSSGFYKRINEAEVATMNFTEFIQNATYNTSLTTASFDANSVRLVESNPGRIENITAFYNPADEVNGQADVALASNGALVSASSNYSPTLDATRLIDGDKSMESKWAAADSPSAPVTIKIILPRTYLINRVAVTNDAVSVSGYHTLGTTTLSVSTDDVAYTAISTYAFNQTQMTYTYQFAPQYARYVKLSIGDWYDSHPEAREVEVFEAPSPGNYRLQLGEFHDTLDDSGKLENPLIFADDFDVDNGWTFETNGSYTDGGLATGRSNPEGPLSHQINHPSSSTVGGDGRIKKTFTVEAGKQYTATFWVYSNYGGGSAGYLTHRAWVDDVTKWELDASTVTGWVRGSFNFTASSTSATIALGSQDILSTGGWGSLGNSWWDGFRLYGPGYAGIEILPDGSAAMMPAKLYMTDIYGYPRSQLIAGAYDSSGGTDVSTRSMDEWTMYPYRGLTTNGNAWTERYDSDGNFNFCTYWGSFCDGLAYNKLAYSHIYFYVPRDYAPKGYGTTTVPTDWRLVRIRFGSDDSARFWIDGELKYSVSAVQGVTLDQYFFDMLLKPGWHRLLVGVSQGSDGWGLAYRFTDTANISMPLVYSLDMPYNFSGSMTTRPISEHVFATSRADFTNGTLWGGITATSEGDLVLSPTYKDNFYTDWVGSESGTNYIASYSGNGALIFYLTPGTLNTNDWDGYTNLSLSGALIEKVTFDYMSNYNNANVLLELVNDTTTFWSNNVYGASYGATTVSIAGGTRFVRFRLRIVSGFTYSYATGEWYGTVDNVRLGMDTAAGAFTSGVFDTKYFNSSLAYVGWTENKPSNTNVAVSVKLGNKSDASDSPWFSVTNGQMSGLPGSGRYIQYRINLTTSNYDYSPTVSDIYVAYKTTPKNRWSSLSGYGLLPYGAVNLALGKSVTCDSEYSGSYACSKGVDGVERALGDTEWASANTAPPHYIYVNLGSVQQIRAVRVATEWQAGYNIRSYKVQVSNDTSTWYDIGAVFRTTEYEQIFYVDRTDAQYVRVYATETGTSGNVARVYEFQVFGNPAAVTYDVLDASNNVLAAGLSSPANLTSSISAASYQLIRLRINLTSSDPRVSPALSGYRVQWFPETTPVLRLKKDSVVLSATLNISGEPSETPSAEVFIPNRDLESGPGTDGTFTSSTPPYWLMGSNYKNDDSTMANAYQSSGYTDGTYFSEGRKSMYGYAYVVSPTAAYVSRREFTNLSTGWLDVGTAPFIPGTLVVNYSVRMRSITSTHASTGWGNFIVPVIVNTTKEFPPADLTGDSCGGTQSACEQHSLYMDHEAPFGPNPSGIYNNYNDRYYGMDQPSICIPSCPEPAWYVYDRVMTSLDNPQNQRLKLKYFWLTETWHGSSGNTYSIHSRIDYPYIYSKTVFAPQNIKMDVNGNGSFDWNYSGILTGAVQQLDIKDILQSTLRDCIADEQGYCFVPIKVLSSTPGTIKMEPSISLNVTPYQLEVASEFEAGAGYDAATNAFGNLTWVMDGVTNPNEMRIYHVYFDTADNPHSAAAYVARTKDTSNCTAGTSCTIKFGIAKSRNQYISAGDVGLPANLTYSMGAYSLSAFKGPNGWHNCSNEGSAPGTYSFSVIKTGAVYDIVREFKGYTGLDNPYAICDYRVYDGTDYVRQNCTTNAQAVTWDCNLPRYASTGISVVENGWSYLDAAGRDAWFRHSNITAVVPSYSAASATITGNGSDAIVYLNATGGSSDSARSLLDDPLNHRIRTYIGAGKKTNDALVIYDRSALGETGLVGTWSLDNLEREYSNASSGLKGWWHFGEGSGYSTTADSSGNGNTGVLYGGTTWNSAAKFDYGLEFDGASGYAQVPNSASLNIVGPMTVEAWVYPKFDSQNRNNAAVAKMATAAGGAGSKFAFELGTGTSPTVINFWVYDGSSWKGSSSTTVLADYTWYHVVGVYDGSYIRVYVNGAQEGTPTAQNNPASSSETLQIGSSQKESRWGKWIVDEVGIYNRALNTDEVREHAGKIARDYSGFSNNGVLYNHAGWVTGRYGKALGLDGSDDYASIAHSSSLKPPAQMTIEAWVKPDAGSLNALREVYRKEDGTNRHLLSFQSTGYCNGGGGTGGCISFGISTGGSYAELDVNIAAADWEGGWHHLVATYDGAYKRIYRDGVEIGNAAASGAIGTSGTAVACIGSSGGSSEFFKGAIDEVRIYNRSLSEAEVREHYWGNYPSPAWRAVQLNNMLRNPTTIVNVSSERLVLARRSLDVSEYTTPTGYWAFGEGSGTVAHDTSGYGHDGNLMNGPSWDSGGKSGYGLLFHGDDDYVEMGPGPSVTGKGPFAITAWVKTTSATNQVIIQQRNSTEINGEYQLMLNPGGAVVWWVYGESALEFSIASARTVNDGNWHHITATRESNGSGQIYVDGILDAYGAGTPKTMIPITVYVGMDRRDLIYPFNGMIDEVRIYSRAPSAQEVKDYFTYNYSSPPATDTLPSGTYWWSVRADDCTLYPNRYSGWAPKFVFYRPITRPTLSATNWVVAPLPPVKDTGFWINATAKCTVETCGDVTATARYGLVTPDTTISTGTQPMSTTSTNPVVCTSVPVDGTCTLNLPVTANQVGRYYVHTRFTSSNGQVIPLETQTQQVDIVPLSGTKCNIFVGATQNDFTDYTNYYIRVRTQTGRHLINYRIRVCWSARYTCGSALYPSCSTGTCPSGKTCQTEYSSCACKA